MELRVLLLQSHYAPFKDGLLGTLKLISLSWKNQYKVLRTELGLLRVKAAEFNSMALHCISAFFLETSGALLRRSLCNRLAAWRFPQSHCCWSALQDVGISPSWTEHRWNLSSVAASTQRVPPSQPRFPGSGTCASPLGWRCKHALLLHAVFHRRGSSFSSFSCSLHQKLGLREQTKASCAG